MELASIGGHTCLRVTLVQDEPVTQDSSLHATETVQVPARRSARPRKSICNFEDATESEAEVSSVAPA